MLIGDVANLLERCFSALPSGHETQVRSVAFGAEVEYRISAALFSLVQGTTTDNAQLEIVGRGSLQVHVVFADPNLH